MTFFVTSAGAGNGANLGGLAGADAHCQKLAAAAGAGNRTWRAYLSTSAADGKPAVNARDRIGKGPWHNAKGAMVARDLGNLHGDTLDEARTGNLVTKNNALTEKGDRVNGVGDTPNTHDILTGSQPDGRATPTRRTIRARTGRAAARARRSWATSTGTAAGSRGIRHIPRAGAARRIWWRRAARGCSTALPATDVLPGQLVNVACRIHSRQGTHRSPSARGRTSPTEEAGEECGKNRHAGFCGAIGGLQPQPNSDVSDARLQFLEEFVEGAAGVVGVARSRRTGTRGRRRAAARTDPAVPSRATVTRGVNEMHSLALSFTGMRTGIGFRHWNRVEGSKCEHCLQQ